jgi:hypothetical protein
MSDKLTVEKERHGEATGATIEAVIAAERQRCINRVLTYAALRDQAAIDLDKAASSSGPEKPSEGAAERARASGCGARHSAFFGRGDNGLRRSSRRNRTSVSPSERPQKPENGCPTTGADRSGITKIT